jgi:glycosyltransferase involved in cell wall biosynthesis
MLESDETTCRLEKIVAGMESRSPATSAERLNRRVVHAPLIAGSLIPGRLKICFISETVHAGVGRHIVDSILALSQRGHEVHLIYSPIRLEAQFLATIRAQPRVHCHAVPMPRGICSADLLAFWRIQACVRAHGPFDVIHGHSSKGGGYARLLKLLGFGPVVYTPHAFATLSPVLPGLKRLVYHGIEVASARLTDQIICTSIGEREHARELGIAEDRLAVIANGSGATAALARHEVRERLGIAADQVVVGFVGRMEDQKAPQRLIAVARQLLPQIPKLVFLMIGDGPKRPFLEVSLHNSGIEDRVRWLGTIEARQYMPGLDIFALPSLYEGFAYVLLEALYAGLPIVCTPVGGTDESIEPGVNGMIVSHDSTEEMAAAIRLLVTDNDLRQAMARASRRRAELFSIARMVNAMEGVYFDVLKARRKSPEIFAEATINTRSG